MRDEIDFSVTRGSMTELVEEYLDHHGDLSRMIDSLRTCDLDDPQFADIIRAKLHRHLLAVTLLLELTDDLDIDRERRATARHDELAAEEQLAEMAELLPQPR